MPHNPFSLQYALLVSVACPKDVYCVGMRVAVPIQDQICLVQDPIFKNLLSAP